MNKSSERSDAAREYVGASVHLVIYSNSALLATIFIIIQALISMGKLDTSEFVCMILFALAIPGLAGGAGVAFSRNLFNFKYSASRSSFNLRFINIYNAVAVCLSLAGVAVIFWHISWIVSIVFVVCSFVVYSSAFVYINELFGEANQSLTPEERDRIYF